LKIQLTSLSVPLDANVFDEGAKLKAVVSETHAGIITVHWHKQSFVLTNIDVDVWVVEGIYKSSVEPTYNTFIGGMSAVITDLNSLVPLLKFSAARALLQFFKHFKSS
jgi:predicted peptidase